MQKSSHDLTHTYCWDSQLAEPSFVAAPVSAFSHAPMADGWDNIIIGMKVNILDTRFVSCPVHRMHLPECFLSEGWGWKLRRRPYSWGFQHCFLGCNCAPNSRIQGLVTFHKCTLIRFVPMDAFTAGAFALWGLWPGWHQRLLDEPLQWKGITVEYPTSKVYLSNFQVHPVGWCATKGKPLIPPKSIQVVMALMPWAYEQTWQIVALSGKVPKLLHYQAKYHDWKEFLVKRLTGARTLPTAFYKVS